MSSTAVAPRSVVSEPSLSLPLARGLAFFALAAFGSLHWMALLEPSAPNRALYALCIAALLMLALAGAARLEGPLRHAAALLATGIGLALALLAAGIADEFLRPGDWGNLAAGISRGIESLPGVRVPYRGVDEWTRIVIALGGTVLTVLAALAAFWPRRSGAGVRPLALFLLVALYAVPAIALDFETEFLRGAALALLVLAFLRLEKLRLGDASTAGAVAAGVAVLALMLAPALDGDDPWWDYERWALGAASARSTVFSWDHSYGPLDWPRDGRELLRVKAPRPAYWKAANLDAFDGIGWRQTSSPESDPEPTDERAIREGTMEIEVSIRNLSSRSFVTAGHAGSVDAPTIREVERGDGTWIASRPLRRGDAYSARVYSPQTNGDQRERTGSTGLGGELTRYRRLLVPGGTRVGQTGVPDFSVLVPAFEDNFNGVSVRRETSSIEMPDAEAHEVLEDGPYGRTWQLAQGIRGRAGNQEDIVQAVLDYLGRDAFTYTESPPLAAQTLEGFLFDARSGYCQQFSGAMALILRMAGVPARVVTGFTSGSQDSKTREYVVRDLDAHSWVEVWYSGLGWVTFDPTPASAPPRAQPDEASAEGGGSAGLPGAPDLGGDRPSDPGRRAAAVEEGTAWGWIAAAGAAGLGLLAGAVALLVRHRRRAHRPPSANALDDLERALRRARLELGPGTTLTALERRFARSPAAAGYVRAISDTRYGGRPSAPSRAQRRGLRSELARGAGLTGRLRAWWALPPQAR